LTAFSNLHSTTQESPNITPSGKTSASFPILKQLAREKLAPRFKYHVQQDGGTAKRAPKPSCLKRRAAEH
jgi:hypothetical protein